MRAKLEGKIFFRSVKNVIIPRRSEMKNSEIKLRPNLASFHANNGEKLPSPGIFQFKEEKFRDVRAPRL